MALFLIGPSGVGKSTLKQRLIKDYPATFVESISCTTRSPRPSEKDGVHYFFISKNEFEKRAKANEFLEWEKIHNCLYGTLLKEVERIKNNNQIAVFDVDLKGAKNLLKKLKEPIENVIFILPPSFEDLRNRLRNRSEKEDEIELRLKRAEWEIKEASNFRHKIVNEDLEVAYQELLAILKVQYEF